MNGHSFMPGLRPEVPLLLLLTLVVTLIPGSGTRSRMVLLAVRASRLGLGLTCTRAPFLLRTHYVRPASLTFLHHVRSTACLVKSAHARMLASVFIVCAAGRVRFRKG
jgi:hypothetical protein